MDSENYAQLIRKLQWLIFGHTCTQGSNYHKKIRSKTLIAITGTTEIVAQQDNSSTQTL